MRFGGLPLGILPGETYEQHVIAMGPGEALVVYSDGLVEGHPDRELTRPRIAAEVDGAASAPEIVDRLLGLAGLSGAPRTT